MRMISTEQKLHILSRIAAALNEKGITWAVGASLLLYFHGLVNEFHDIDIMVAEKDADAAEEILNALGQRKPARPNPQYGTKRFIEYIIEGVEIDFIAGFSILFEGREYDCSLTAAQIEKCVEVEGEPVPLQYPGCWKRYYRLMGRTARVALLEGIEER